MPEVLIRVGDEVWQTLLGSSETGMGFQIVRTPDGMVAVLSDGSALLFYPHQRFYNVDDVLKGNPIPSSSNIEPLTISEIFSDRAKAQNALQKVNISPQFIGTAGAFPLIAWETLSANTIFYRYLTSKVDRRYFAGSLKAGTYLTTELDKTFANTEFATVGRYALPILFQPLTSISTNCPQVLLSTLVP
jgi:hypothetical protein